jgi:hypothetical protein
MRADDVIVVITLRRCRFPTSTDTDTICDAPLPTSQQRAV